MQLFNVENDVKTALLVFAGAGVGGVLRHFLNAAVIGLTGMAFPWGIFIINVTGSLAMGVVVELLALRMSPSQDIRLFIVTGILGGYTTFSTFSLDSALLYERGQFALAAAYVLGSVVLAIGGLFFGMYAVRILSP